jgi:DNA-binding SARP family transcriptional activator
MSGFQVRMFGKLSVCCGEVALDGLEARKAQELFCYLLLNGQRPQPRELLADLLWGDNPNAQAKKSLRQTLWQLQAALGAYARQGGDRILLVGAEWVQLSPEATLWLDVGEFERACTAVQGQHGAELESALADQLRAAVELYRGDLLEGWYQDWCLYERERLESMYLGALDKLMAFCEATGEFEAGLSYGARALRHDRARERTHRQLMRIYYRAGDRAAALRQYQRCVSALSADLDTQPSRPTVDLYQQILADQLVEPAAGFGSAVQGSTATFPTLLGHLKQLLQTLASLQVQIHDKVQILEQAVVDQDEGVNQYPN